MWPGWSRIVAALCIVAPAVQAAGWFEGARPSPAARQAVELLAAADAEGLRPEDYAAGALQQALERAAQEPPLDAAAIAHLQQGLDLAMQRYLTDLHRGRVQPRQARSGYEPGPACDAVAQLREALQQGRLAEVARAAAPQLPLYAQLRRQLAIHRALGNDAAWSRPLPPLPGGARAKLEPGQAWAGLPLLARRLFVLGDLHDAPADGPLRYEGALAEALKSFQTRHGLAADGVIGSATLAQLQVPPAARAQQIVLTMERLRWTPLLQGPRMIVVNIPEFVLRAYEVRDGRVSVQREMRVIVGKAFDTRTPLIDEDLRFIEFSPYWNVPPSIARGETVPKLKRDPGTWEREGFEFVAGDGRVVTTLSAQGLQSVLDGSWRIRQRPGPRNALGDIKFVFPNRENIYLHHTPATELFARTRRDFSHGCIRVEQPVELATFVLQDMPGWDEARVREAMARGTSATLKLQQPVRVLIAYGTALVKGGRPYFFDDLYGLDRQLEAALRARPPLAWAPRGG